mmetsp:Transcript_14343/g.10371  ORF Transcript_14343/g.10371 Transcript_14343/m.10371 type:complete len:87 (+) Transcript_14343:695-955(+)
MPTIEFRLQTVRLMEELGAFKSCVRILDTVVAEEDQDAESWYHLAFCNFKLGKLRNAKECLNNVKEVMVKTKKVDVEIKAAAEELY